MNASTQTLGASPVESFRLARDRIPSAAHACTATKVARVDSGIAPDAHALAEARANRTYCRPGGRAEQALFVVTLVAIGYLYFGVCLWQVL